MSVKTLLVAFLLTGVIDVGVVLLANGQGQTLSRQSKDEPARAAQPDKNKETREKKDSPKPADERAELPAPNALPKGQFASARQRSSSANG